MATRAAPLSGDDFDDTATMTERVQQFAWETTALGSANAWPQSLRTTVDLMLASGHAMCLAWGPSRVLLYNDAYAPFLGALHPRALGRRFDEVWADIWDDIGPLVERTFAGETVTLRDMPLVMMRNGYPEDTWWTFSYSPVRDESGTVAGLLNVAADSTSRVVAERARDAAVAELRESEAFMKSVLTASTDCIKVVELDGTLSFMSEGGMATMEISDFNTVKGCPWPDMLQGEGVAAARAAIERARQGHTVDFQSAADTFLGTPKFWSVSVSPIRDGNSEITRVLSVSRDHTALEQARKQQRLLNGELSHRLKNVLAMVQSIASQTLRGAASMEDAAAAFSSRLASLGKATDVLTASSWRATDLHEVIEAGLAGVAGARERVLVEGPAIRLNAQGALALTLALHELATNAIKYGALSNDGGTVSLQWSVADVDGEPHFSLRWREQGGPPVSTPTRRGFGSRMIERSLRSYFRGETALSYPSAGVEFRLDAPLAGAGEMVAA